MIRITTLCEESKRPDFTTAKLPTGFTEIDQIIGGLGDSSLVVIGGRPSQGSSTLCFNIASRIAYEQNKATTIFSQSCDSKCLWEILLADTSGVSRGSDQTSESARTRIASAIGYLSEAPIYINDTASITPGSLLKKLQSTESMEHSFVVLIDSLQYMQADEYHQSRVDEYTAVGRDLARIAKEQKITIIVNTDIDPDLESRTDMRPTIQDFNVCGNLVLDADLVLSIYRDDIYNPDCENMAEAEIKVLKNRFGPHGSCKLDFRNQTFFSSLDTSMT